MAPITNAYSAKGESLRTLEMLHKGSNHQVFKSEIITPCTLAFNIVFPLITTSFLGFLFYHLIKNNKINFFREERETSESKPNMVLKT